MFPNNLAVGPRRPVSWPRPPDGILNRDWPTWFAFRDTYGHRHDGFYFNVLLPSANQPDRLPVTNSTPLTPT